MITALVAARPTYGCRRIAAILNRQLRSEDLAEVLIACVEAEFDLLEDGGKLDRRKPLNLAWRRFA